VVEGALWLFGGMEYASSDKTLSDLWSSTDGIHWQEIPYQPAVLPRYRHAAMVRGDTLFIFDGLNEAETGIAPYVTLTEILFARIPGRP